MKRKRSSPAAIAAYLNLLNANKMRIFQALPGETEAQARERLRLERGDLRTDQERAEERQAETLRNLRQQNDNPSL